jgi:hypothetical protein
MSTFRRYGGLNYSSTNNITRSFISNSDQMNTNNFSGLENASLSFCAFESNQIKFDNAVEFNALANDSRFNLGGKI